MNGLALTAEIGEHMHPGTRLVAADEWLEVLDLWIEAAFRANKRGDCERFCKMVEMRERLLEHDWETS